MKSRLLTNRTAASKDDSTNWNSLRVFPLWMHDGTLGRRCCEAGVGVRSFPHTARMPWVAQPVDDANTLSNDEQKLMPSFQLMDEKEWTIAYTNSCIPLLLTTSFGPFVRILCWM